ncbi:MAG TPA: hypothetical protein DDY49_06210 [Paenibacillaceae bacterium]|mgnify:CR=1 FL=1|nr:hypothetical protein [Paenibacillaceae bacterium]
MKKIFVVISFVASLVLSGCSFLQETNNTLEYVNKATEHINNLSNFADQAPQMIQQAALNAEVKTELENQVNSLVNEINEFNQIDAPTIAKDLHQQIVSKNNLILEELQPVIQNGQILVDKLEDTQIFITIKEINTLLNQLQQLGL